MEIERSSQDTESSYAFQDPVSVGNHLWSLECERLWQRIKDVQKGLESLPPQRTRTPTLPQTAAVDNERLLDADVTSDGQTNRLLQEYEKRLKAELNCLQRGDVDDFSTPNREVEYLILRQSLRKQEIQRKESLSHVTAKHSSLIDTIGQEEDMNAMLRKVQDSLKTKIAATSQTVLDREGTPHATACADLKTKVNELKKANKHFQKGLKDLLSAFPSPSSSAASRQQKKKAKNALDNTRDFDDDFMNLSSIIGKLMEQTLNTPAQPYIDISTNMWPQHIEFLLRSQIVLKDPENSSRMKLVPFHL